MRLDSTFEEAFKGTNEDLKTRPNYHTHGNVSQVSSSLSRKEKMIIKYYTKDVYGKTYNFIADKDQARDFLALTGKKTISSFDMRILGSWGIKFERCFEDIANHDK